MLISSIKTGFSQTWSYKRMVFVFFLVNFLFGLFLMLPGTFALDNFVGRSLMGMELGGRFNMDFLFEFFKNNPSVVSIYQGLFLIVPAVYWLLLLFLSGGAFAVFAAGEKYSPSAFWGNAAKYFGRFIRLGIMSLLILGLFFLIQFLLVAGVQRLIFGSDPYQNVTYWAAWIKFGLRIISILLFGLIFDYGRIHAVLNDEHKMRISLWRGIKFAFGNFSKTFALTFLLFLLGAVMLVIYNPIANSLTAPNGFVVFLLFVVQQLYMFWRMVLRLTLYSGQMHLFRKLATATDSLPAERSEDLGIEGAPV